MVRKCKVCGESYKTCYSCEKERSWRVHTDTSEHYYIWTVLMSYQSTRDAAAAYQALVKRGVDFRHTDGFLPGVQQLLAEIYALVHPKRRKDTLSADKGDEDTQSTVDETRVKNSEKGGRLPSFFRFRR